MDLLVLGLLSLVLSAQSLVSVCGVDDVSHLKNSGGHYLPISQKRNSACLLHSANVSYIYCQKENCKVSSEPEDLPLAIQGIVLLCGGLLCPCLRPKIKKEFEDDFLATKINPLDTDSSIETSEKITTTPSRAPPSPSRFVMSPPFRRIGSLHLSFHQISEATQRFSPLCKLGDGVVGTVYKAVLPDDQVVAIKIARKDQIPDLREEFSNEVEILAKIEHQNLVRLLGYTENEYEHIIITEYVPNGTLREHLDGLHGKILDFSQRLEIAIDVAHALTYLHVYAEKTIIHRDVRSSNILLTESYRAKVSDFGFASDSTDRKKSHAYTRVKGTAGYLDPEYLRTYQLTPESDVFSFGILLVEILSSRRPIEMKRSPEEKITVTWAFKKFEEGNMYDILDPLLEEVVDHKVVRKMFNLAFDCSAPTCEDRPDMRAVGQQLWEIRKEYVKSHKRDEVAFAR